MSGMQALAIDEKAPIENLEVLSKIPLFLYHGNSDDLLPIANVLKTYEYLKSNFGSNFNLIT